MSTSNEQAYVRTEMVPEMAPPASESGVLGWMRKNLFSSIPNTILTLVAAYLLWAIIPGFLSWGFFDAVWSGSDRSACATEAQGGVLPDGWNAACWPYVIAYLKSFTYGRYPDAELWRANLTMVLFVVGLVPLLIPSAPYKALNLIYLSVIFPVLAFVLLTGGNVELNGFLLPDSWVAPGLGKFWLDYLVLTAVICGIVAAYMRGTDTNPIPGVMVTLGFMAALAVILAFVGINFGLEHVETDIWGGFLMTLVIAVIGIAVSLPLGVLLALGRRSNMPAIKFVCIVFIEFWRGVPLITVLFMASNMLPLLLPEGVTFDKLLRALIGVALFASAYMAEVVRGGLQAVPKGQYEGAMALGLSWGQMTRMIVLPQAIKIVIPGIVNTFIGLFKDTTLVSIIGLLDFLGMINSSHSDSNWATPVQALTSYLFCAIVFFIFCFGMSRYSIYMEDKLNTGHR